MKIIVFSDSHGDKKSMKLLIERIKPDTVIHLGDGIDDILALEKEYPELRFEYVRGSCDTNEDVPKEKLITLDGFNFFLTHGDIFDDMTCKELKMDTEKIFDYARKSDVSMLLHGHTHVPTLLMDNEIKILNPGIVKNTPGKNYPTCGLITTNKSHLICEILFAPWLI